MTFFRNITAFSQNGEYLAYSSPDGCLKIWETSTNILKQEYTPSSHLSATCSALVWGPCKQTSLLPKSPKKAKSHDASMLKNLHLIAMGTLTGDILLYSFANADLYTCLTSGHTSTVNDLCWGRTSNSLFSCSNDQCIIQWDVCTGKTKAKWKADKVPVNSICVIDENNLLSASNSIQWWDINQQIILKSFNGHATEVFQLLPLISENNSSNPYFLSSAIGDRVISAWHLSESGSKRAVASFVSSGEPININVQVQTDDLLKMSVVTKEGLFHLFEHVLNGKTKKPLMPKFTIQIASKPNSTVSKPHSIPVLATSISHGLDSCIFSYGSFLKPLFETINISEFDKDMFLVRDLSSSLADSIENSVSKVKHTEKDKHVKSLAPGHMTESSLVKSKKRKQEDVDVKELPMEIRLKALELTVPPNSGPNEPVIKADSKVHVLLQGLQSDDNDMLNSVLHSSDEAVVQNTLERLPLNAIPLLLTELYKRMHKKDANKHAGLLWLSSLLHVHRSYLMSSEDIDRYFEPFSQLFEAKATENFAMMSRLRGCFDIALAKAASSCSEKADITSTPLTEYQSDSSDESEDEVEMSENSSVEETEDDVQEYENQSSNSERDMED